MNLNYKNLVIVTILAAAMAYFYDVFIALVVWGCYMLFVIASSIKEDYRREKSMAKIDRSGMMKEIRSQAKQRIEEGKAADYKEAAKQLKEEGVWSKLVQKFRKTDDSESAKRVLPQEKTVKDAIGRGASKGLNWSFDEEAPMSNDVTVEVTKEKGREYSALVRNILADGTTNWAERINQLDELRVSIETTVQQLKASYDEIKNERVLVENLARLKQKQLE